jgi:methylenetetrahydrofolate--tRNA-(uracil-5-)-methyltransferase
VPYFDGCLPIEVMAERGRETLRHGPMKPVGLTNPRDPTGQGLRHRPAAPGQRPGHAVEHGGLPDQAEARRPGRDLPDDPGPANAQFARLGGLHRNTFINSPRLLDRSLRMKVAPRLRFAGQMTGVEGYVESAATACWPAASPPPSAWARRWTPRRRPPPWAPWSTTSPAATSKEVGKTSSSR